jgi:hypothetical protein
MKFFSKRILALLHVPNLWSIKEKNRSWCYILFAIFGAFGWGEITYLRKFSL